MASLTQSLRLAVAAVARVAVLALTARGARPRVAHAPGPLVTRQVGARHLGWRWTGGTEGRVAGNEGNMAQWHTAVGVEYRKQLIYSFSFDVRQPER